MSKVTLEQLAYHNLERHSLIDRAPAMDTIRVVEDICGLNAQGALNYNQSLWARVEGVWVIEKDGDAWNLSVELFK